MAQEVRRRLPVLQGILPIDRSYLGPTIVAGCTLAALGIPETMGYATIAGMPVITGLYTILIPIAVFAVLGSSRHLVVGADSASAAILAAGLVGLAATGSADYVSLAGIVAIITAAILLLARLFKLGFLADFLSRSVLIGFLTGVGIQVAMGQVAGMFGVPGGTDGGTVRKFFGTLSQIPSQTVTDTLLTSVGVLATILILKKINRKIPGGLIAVVGAIAVSYWLDLASDGVAVVGKVQSGLPSFGIPSFGWDDWTKLIATAASIFIVILAQSAATSRAYAARYSEQFDENVDLVGLSFSNLSAGLTGTFVVNGSPTKTQMVDDAGGRSQLSMLVTAVIVLVVLLWLTAPISYMPEAVLSSIVFLIGVELVDIKGMRRIWYWRRDEFWVAAITAAVVVAVGVKQGIILAMIMSLLDHLRRSYRPHNTYLVKHEDGSLHSDPVVAGEGAKMITPGLVIYRFGAIMYYANSERLIEDVRTMESGDARPDWLCLDAEMVTDVDFSAGATILDALRLIQAAGTTLVLARVKSEVRAQLDRYGVTEVVGADAYYGSVEAVLKAFAARSAS